MIDEEELDESLDIDDFTPLTHYLEAKQAEEDEKDKQQG